MAQHPPQDDLISRFPSFAGGTAPPEPVKDCPPTYREVLEDARGQVQTMFGDLLGEDSEEIKEAIAVHLAHLAQTPHGAQLTDAFLGIARYLAEWAAVRRELYLALLSKGGK